MENVEPTMDDLYAGLGIDPDTDSETEPDPEPEADPELDGGAARDRKSVV